MNHRNNTSIDGFVARQPQRSRLGTPGAALHSGNTTAAKTKPSRRVDASVSKKSTGKSTVIDDINGSLRAIDEDASKHIKKKKNRRKKRKIVKIISIILGLMVAGLIGFGLYKAWMAGAKMFQGNLLNIFQQQELKMDEHGRSNVLILGSTDDMAGRDGATLTDSMMVISVDQKKKDAYMFSIPRDLWAKYDRACFTGYEGKINAYYTCASDGDTKEDEAARMNATKELVGGIFGMDIQYVVHVNTVVIRDGVDAVGGVTVNVESDDERGVLDSTFDDMCRGAPDLCPNGHYMQFPNGPNKMNGNQAMAFSQARGMGVPSYGLSGSNFSREKNQQLVLMALKNQATSTGTLTDITKVVSLIDAMGNNLRTNIDAKEIQTIMKLAADTQESDIHRLSFIEEDNMLMTTGSSPDGQSIVRPVAGLYDYSQIRKYLKDNIFATPLSKEGAKIAVLNGGGPAGQAQLEADELTEDGFDVVYVGNADKDITASYAIYKLGQEGSLPLTKAELEKILKVSASGTLPYSIAAEVDYVVVIGPQSEENGIIN